MKTTVIYHSADFDGLFCREIARKYLPNAEFVGWDFKDQIIPFPDEGTVYVLDLPADRPFGIKFAKDEPLPGGPDDPFKRMIWIDHHKSSIDSTPDGIKGYRIDGVAACRLAWQWFFHNEQGCVNAPSTKEPFVKRKVIEPLAVRLAGEYDVWDKRDPNAELFQHGLRSQELTPGMWKAMFEPDTSTEAAHIFIPVVEALLEGGRSIQYYRQKQDESAAKSRSFDVSFEGLNFLALNALYCNSATFVAATRADHDGLLGFWTDGKQWSVSLYSVPGKDIDLSQIAVKYGGGGHRGACGFRCDKLPFLPG